MRYRGITILLIAAAGILPLCAQDEVTRLRSENRQLRENNIRLEQELAAVKLWLSGVAQDQLNRDAAERERRVLLALKEFSRRGNKLVIDAVTAGEEFRRLLSGVPLGPARKAQLQLLIDALDDSARKFSALSIPGGVVPGIGGKPGVAGCGHICRQRSRSYAGNGISCG